MQATGVDSERGVWKRFDQNTCKERGGECLYSLNRTKAILERQECKAEFKRKQSNAIEECNADVRQILLEAKEEITHLRRHHRQFSIHCATHC